jgi:hypothetical protein
MRALVLALLALLFVSLAGLEMVMSAMPDEPVTPAELQTSAPPLDTPGVAALLCDRPVQDAGSRS